MLENIKKHNLSIITGTLIVANLFIFQIDAKSTSNTLTLAMLDVGQGEAIFIESPTKTQILIDGGPPKKILGQIAKVMPAFDNTIDAIIITNPDQDHVGGFLDVLKTYKVGMVLEPGTFNDSKTYQNLKDEIKNQKIKTILARKNMRLKLGNGANLDILFPDRDVSAWSPNDGSVVARLAYGKTSVMLTGDATVRTEKIILENNPAEKLRSMVLKAGHHGSHTSTSSEFVKTVAPLYALISSGKNNRYNHPHTDVLNTLEDAKAKIFRTDLFGTIIMKSDGKIFELP